MSAALLKPRIFAVSLATDVLEVMNSVKFVLAMRVSICDWRASPMRRFRDVEANFAAGQRRVCR